MSLKATLLGASLIALCACESADRQSPTPTPPGKRTLSVRLVDGFGKPVRGNVWWAKDPDAEFGTPVGPVKPGGVVLKDLPHTPVVLVALPDGFVVPSEGWPRKVVGTDVKEVVLRLGIGSKRNLRVLGWKPEWSGLVYLAAATDLEPSHHGVEKDGAIHLEGLRKGVSYNLYIREFETGRAALFRSLSADEPWPEIELAVCCDVTGKVIYPTGCDYANVALMVDKAVLIDGREQEDGTFRIQAVPPGAYTAVAYTTFRDLYLTATAEVQAGKSVVLDLTKPRD